MNPDSDTIAALSTPPGESAIAVVRASGPLCSEIARGAFRLGADPRPRFSARGTYRSLSGAVLDEAMFVFFRGPSSYTGEDMLEVGCHGNPFIVQRVLEDMFARGARAASHGEFTRRAFENGKLDLSQAEAVMLMVAARSEKSLEAARRQLGGELSKRINSMCDALVLALAHIEAHIDFSEEDLPPESYDEPVRLLEVVVRDAARLAESSRYGAVLRDGLNVSIIGEPNVGKSSLMNRLLGRERAIVSPSAGTTRDFIVERASIGGCCVNLADTAGLRESPDEIEREGVRRAVEMAREADLKLFVVDSSSPSDGAAVLALPGIDPADTIIVLNKCDLPRALPAGAFSGFETAEVSCLEDTGVGRLRGLISDFISKRAIASSFDDVLVSARHSSLVSEALASARSALEMIGRGAPAELVSSDVRAALESLGEIVGRGDREEVLDRIFSTFCIGK